MTRHTLRPGTACVHLVRDNVVEFCRPDLRRLAARLRKSPKWNWRTLDEQ
jgi:hypothetical protein